MNTTQNDENIAKVIKRDGTIVPFDSAKIKSAIFKASIASGEKLLKAEVDELVSYITETLDNTYFNDKKNPTVEEIQDVVEKQLIQSDYAATAKSYILYRADHAKARASEADLMEIYKELTYKSSKDSNIKRENANINTDTAMGTMLKYGSEGSKHFIENYVLPKDIAAAHIGGDIHIHDEDFYMLTETCCQIDLLSLFHNGFSTGHGFLREPNDIISYAALACIAIQANQNEMHGGQAVPNFDYSMAPGVAKTFKKEYAQKLTDAYEDLFDLDDEADFIKGCIQDVEKGMALVPQLGQNEEEFDSLVAETIAVYVPVVRKTIDKAVQIARKRAVKSTNRKTFQAMEAFIHNLNTMHSRAGAQVPFSSISYGTDTSPEGRMVMKNLLLATEAGLGNGETPIFPVQIFKVKEGVNYNESDPNYDLFKLSIRVSAKRLFPNYDFLDAPFNLQYYKPGHPETEVAYMGCRTRVMANVYDPDKAITYGRGNLSFTSINLPRLGIEAKGSLLKFYELLDTQIDLIIRQLLHRFKIQCSKKVRNYPFLMGQGIWIDSEKLGPDDSVEKVLKHGTLSLGFIGLAETLVALTGKHHGESAESQKIGLEIIGHMRKRMDDESKKTKLNFTLLATPAEGLSGTFVKIDKKKYGIIPGVTDRDYYTNSFHVPVYFPIKAYRKIQIEAPYHNLTNAGHISYVELDGDTCKNLEAFESIIRCMKESGIGYGSVNHPVDRDPVCGYNGIIDNECPKCHRKEGDGQPNFERIRRITGYLVGTTDRWNNAKRAEEKDRVKHGLN